MIQAVKFTCFTTAGATVFEQRCEVLLWVRVFSTNSPPGEETRAIMQIQVEELITLILQYTNFRVLVDTKLVR